MSPRDSVWSWRNDRRERITPDERITSYLSGLSSVCGSGNRLMRSRPRTPFGHALAGPVEIHCGGENSGARLAILRGGTPMLFLYSVDIYTCETQFRCRSAATGIHATTSARSGRRERSFDRDRGVGRARPREGSGARRSGCNRGGRGRPSEPFRRYASFAARARIEARPARVEREVFCGVLQQQPGLPSRRVRPVRGLERLFVVHDGSSTAAAGGVIRRSCSPQPPA